MDKHQLRLEIDQDSNMGYIHLTPYTGNPTSERFLSEDTKRIEGTPLAVDRNNENRIVGIEIYNVDRVLQIGHYKSGDLELRVDHEQGTAKITFNNVLEREIGDYPVLVGFNEDSISHIIIKDIQNNLLRYFS